MQRPKYLTAHYTEYFLIRMSKARRNVVVCYVDRQKEKTSFKQKKRLSAFSIFNLLATQKGSCAINTILPNVLFLRSENELVRGRGWYLRSPDRIVQYIFGCLPILRSSPCD